jgi:hypothetical protein
VYIKVKRYSEVMGRYLPAVPLRTGDLRSSGAWLSGFFEGGSCVSIDPTQYQINLSTYQKAISTLNDLRDIYGGNVYFDKTCNRYR